ncbi:hypothetical protein [Candidatus Thiosymbion oneisti]|uniref:hypothetical protein n=1 Tax=Candidatus Thiosymbion oneisti TaxID=589554 RepID=UPI000B10D6A2|nr:hypothetical protein [Candidatus Thiosymbion oneisti]
MSFIRSSGFWTSVIAFIALVLSQFPPVTKLFPSWGAEIEIAARMALDNKFGIVSYSVYFNIKNVGNRPIKVEEVVLSVKRPDGSRKEYEAKDYRERESSSVIYPIVSLNIEEGDQWSENVLFGPDTPPDTQEKFNDLRMKIGLDILEERQRNSDMACQKRWYEAKEENVDKAVEFFKENFDLPKGEYIASFKVYGRDNALIAEKSYRFTIYDYHIKMFKSQVDDYKYGIGVHSPASTARSVVVDLIPNE